MTNLATNLVATAQRLPDKTGIKLDQGEVTWAQLHGAAADCGTAARGRLEPDRVSSSLPNVPAYPVLFYGTLLGGIVVPMNPLLKSGEISYYYQDAGTKFSFVWPDFAEEARKAAQIAAIEGSPPRSSSARRWGRWRGAAGRRAGDRAGRPRRRRHRGDPLHLGHDGQAEGQRELTHFNAATPSARPRTSWR